jgi:TRAP-type C4-dicarboxylate transport system permease small subunit
MLHKFLGLCCRLFSFLMVLSLLLMVAMVFGNVVLRYGFNTGIMVSEELSRWLFVWMTFLGAIVAMRSHAHLGTDSLVSRLPVGGKKLCLGTSHLLMLFLCFVMGRGAWQQVLINWPTSSR